MDVFFKFLISATVGGLIGGFGNAVLGEGLSGITRDSISGKLDLGSWKNITIGVLSGVAWLAPNADRWTNVTTPTYSSLGMIAIQTLVVGLAGSAWLTAYVNGNTLKSAVADAAAKQGDPQVASQIAGAKSTKEIVGLLAKLQP
jgi:hypothetical protein